ncbi:MAG: acyl carrier protein [Desulfobacter sp.]|nr:MAG: acyl carrier protein [Desulfobacter sp.]
MMKEKVRQKLTPIFRDIFGDNALEVRDEMTSDDVYKWDSLTHLNLILEIEKAFDIKFALGELQEMNNVSALIDMIIDKGGKF